MNATTVKRLSTVLIACVYAVASAEAARGQSLRGSRASIDRMYRQARAEKLAFYETPRGVRNAVESGRLVRLTPNASFTLHEVDYAFVRPTTSTFVRRLATQYEESCGEELVVTSAVRPATRQPFNSSERSVHPTGMAVDFRKPENATCRRWLRATLLELEGAGVLEATEEFSPPHFHVAVFPSPYRRYVEARKRGGERARVASGGRDGD